MSRIGRADVEVGIVVIHPVEGVVQLGPNLQVALLAKAEVLE
jgi:hypothetical protein